MELTEKNSPFATEPIGRLIVRFAVPCVISLLVNALYKSHPPPEKQNKPRSYGRHSRRDARCIPAAVLYSRDRRLRRFMVRCNKRNEGSLNQHV